MADDPAPVKSCVFTTLEGRKCNRLTRDGFEHCPLHADSDCSPEIPIPANPFFEAEFSSLLDAKDGNWCGFAFPEGIKLPPEIDFPINARGCRFNGLTLENVLFREPVDLSDTTFNKGLTLKGVTFSQAVNFSQCRFHGPVFFQNVFCKSAALFPGAEFLEQATFLANFSGLANFNSTTFRDGVTFAGWRNIMLRASSLLCLSASCSATFGATGAQSRTLLEIVRLALARAKSWTSQKTTELKRWLDSKVEALGLKLKGLKRKFATSDPDTKVFKVFEGEAQFQNALFMKLDRTVFFQVDLSNVFLLGTNLRGAKFIGVTWWQATLGRNGIRDEAYIRQTNDGPYRCQALPILEETCRNVRVALEENRSFDKATDFYIGEMDAARLQLAFLRRHIFSVLALYNSVSRYGSSVGVALRFLVLLFLLHLSLTLWVQTLNNSLLTLHDLSQTTLISFKTLLFYASTASDNHGVTQDWINVVFKIVGLVQATMVTLAFRARTKRH